MARKHINTMELKILRILVKYMKDEFIRSRIFYDMVFTSPDTRTRADIPMGAMRRIMSIDFHNGHCNVSVFYRSFHATVS